LGQEKLRVRYRSQPDPDVSGDGKFVKVLEENWSHKVIDKNNGMDAALKRSPPTGISDRCPLPVQLGAKTCDIRAWLHD
jgi:hypothetical protein